MTDLDDDPYLEVPPPGDRDDGPVRRRVPVEQIAAGIAARPLSLIEPEAIRWTVRDWLMASALNLLAAPGGMGKGVIVSHLVAVVTRGRAFCPGGVPAARPMRVLVLAGPGEDRARTGWRPRLGAAGADLSMVHVVEQWGEGVDAPAVSIVGPLALDLLRATIMATGAGLVVLDALQALAPGVDLNKGGDVRATLDPVSRIAAELRCCIILLHHTRKGSSANAAEAVSGNAQIVNACRSTLTLGHHPDDAELSPSDRRRVLALSKSNVSARSQSIEFRIGSVPMTTSTGVEVFDDQGMVPTVPVVVGLGASTVSADAVTNTESHGEANETVRARDVILEALRAVPSGEMSAGDLRKVMDAEGIASRTAERARSALRADGRIDRRKQSGPGGAWSWFRVNAEIDDREVG